jgi:poly-gamma-glutamate synthesis protein (capsule biosynthesis protein)
MQEIQLEENSQVLFLGDFLYDYDYLNSDIIEISSWVRDNNYLTVLNLESPLVRSGNPINKRGPHLAQSDLTIEILNRLNVICVCLANNHIFDYGWDAFRKTIQLLEDNSIHYIGAGDNQDSAAAPLLVRFKNGKEIILTNYGWEIEETIIAVNDSFGCNSRDDKWVIECTRNLRAQFPQSYIVNIFHWGFEFNRYPMPYDISLAHKSIDSGADLIIGHHPHCIQAKESYNNKLIYYSLGNFYFGSLRDTFNQQNREKRYICDTGLLVLLDINDYSLQDRTINYDRESSLSIIGKKHITLDDISGVDYTSESYKLLAQENAFKVNPILSSNRETAKRQLKKLKKQYKIASFLKVLQKTSLGTSIYNLIKIVAKRMI